VLFIEHSGEGGLPDREVAPDLDAELARDLGLARPWAHGPKTGYCPGVGEYGHGLTLRAVHAGTCCERWDTARTARLAERELEAG
jgi:hypothetical protein